jgi:hypothetical protein
LVVSHVLQGTKVVDQLPEQNQTPLRRAALFNRTEAFLLESMTVGYSPDEIEQSLAWHRITGGHFPSNRSSRRLMCCDLLAAMTLIASHYHEVNEGFTLQLTFTGSLVDSFKKNNVFFRQKGHIYRQTLAERRGRGRTPQYHIPVVILTSETLFDDS